MITIYKNFNLALTSIIEYTFQYNDPWVYIKYQIKFENIFTWTAPDRDSVCTDSPVSGPTRGSSRRSRCSSRRIRPAVPRHLPGRTTICIWAPTAPNTSSSSRDLTIGTPACTRICRPAHRPPRRQTEPSGSPTARRAPPRSEECLRTAHRDRPSTAVRRNTCTI